VLSWPNRDIALEKGYSWPPADRFRLKFCGFSIFDEERSFAVLLNLESTTAFIHSSANKGFYSCSTSFRVGRQWQPISDRDEFRNRTFEAAGWLPWSLNSKVTFDWTDCECTFHDGKRQQVPCQIKGSEYRFWGLIRLVRTQAEGPGWEVCMAKVSKRSEWRHGATWWSKPNLTGFHVFSPRIME